MRSESETGFGHGGAARVAVAAIVVLQAAVAGAWGHAGHRLVNELALEALPAGPLAKLLDADRARVVAAGTEPDDLFRQQFPKLEPERHFLDLDVVASPPYDAGVPVTAAALDGCVLPAPLRAGRLPLAVRQHYDELVRRLAAGDRVGAQREAGLLGHYVADATMPLHATSNFDGWTSGNRGIHELLEVTFYRWARTRIERGARRQATTADRAGSPEELTVELLRESLAEVPSLLSIDRAGLAAGGKLAGRDGDALEPAVPVLARRLARAARALAGLWIRAWDEAHVSSSSR